jgi:hypothetical protein
MRRGRDASTLLLSLPLPLDVRPVGALVGLDVRGPAYLVWIWYVTPPIGRTPASRTRSNW